MKLFALIKNRYITISLILFAIAVLFCVLISNNITQAYAEESGLIELWIIDVQAEDEHQYDGEVDIQLAGGKLVDEGGTEISDESLGFDLGVGTIPSANVASNVSVSTNIILTGTSAVLYHLNQPTDLTTSVTPAPISIENIHVNDKEYDGGADAEIASYDILGIIDGDSIDVSIGAAHFDNKNVGVNKPVLFSDIVIQGEDSGNYRLVSLPTATASISQKLITIEGVTVANKVYDGSTNATILDHGIINGKIGDDDLTIGVGIASFSSKNVSSSVQVVFADFTIGGDDSENYRLVSQPNDITAEITPKEITIIGIIAINCTEKNSIIKLVGGQLQGIMADDDVGFTLGEGYIDSNDVGEHAVKTDIKLTGVDSGNYILLQPDDINVEVFGSVRSDTFIAIIVVAASVGLVLCVLVLLYFIIIRPIQLVKVKTLSQGNEQLNEAIKKQKEKNSELEKEKSRVVQENQKLREQLLKPISAVGAHAVGSKSIEQLRRDLEDVEGLAKHYKKQLDKLMQTPDVKSAVKGLLPMITELLTHTRIAPPDRESHVLMQAQKIVSYLRSQNMSLIISNVGDTYNPEIHSSQGNEPAPTPELKNTIQSLVCCGIVFYDGTIEKEQVILYI